MAKSKKKSPYDATLNLPQTEFPMRANLPAKEPEILRKWEEINIYDKVQQKNAGRKQFILHDGPPYANGDIHLGHTLNKVLKDIIVKYHSMAGFDAPYIPGWDTHGLPIEQQAIKALGIDRHRTDVLDFRRHCKEYALDYMRLQRREFKRLGVRGDWEHPYLTLTPDFESAQIKVFGSMVDQGFIYKGLKPVYWCTSCETALAEAEIEYKEKTSYSIYVAFPVKDGRGIVPNTASLVIWTTTPWTLPANMGICVHPDHEYVLVKADGQEFVVARELLSAVAEEIGWQSYGVAAAYSGRDLEHITCQHPFMDRESLVMLGEHVTMDAGTGCVHTAPGHGEDDFYVGRQYDLPVISPVDDKGHFTEEAGKYEGLFVHKANKSIVEDLQASGHLLHVGELLHQYPYCWRCKNPIIYRATEQWFASVEGFRNKALQAIDEVKWIPGWGRDRIYNMVRDRSDWCISRQRTWGVPIPIFYCNDCGHIIVNQQTIERISEIFAEEGSDAWFAREASDLLPDGFVCPQCQGTDFSKEKDTMDVWFDSGSSHMAVLAANPQLRWPADLYLEGSDQHRGWFNSSLSTAVAVRGRAPYETVLTHGFIVDEKGHKMSKSAGNGVDPNQMIAELGADILRLWVASVDYRSDIAVSDNIIRQSSEAYRKIRNTCRFMLGNLNGFNFTENKQAYEQLGELDRWILMRLEEVASRVKQAYDDYEFHVVFHTIHNFCTVDLSNIYFDVSKDALYCLQENDPGRRAIQTVLYIIIRELLVLLTPILAFTSEEIWSYLRKPDEPISVQLLEWPQSHPEWLDNQLKEKLEQQLAVREVVTKALEEARAGKLIGHTLGAAITIFAEDKWAVLLREVPALDKFFIAAAVDIKPAEERTADSISLPETEGLWVAVMPAPGEKCERCWTVAPHSQKYPALCDRCAQVIEVLEEK